MTNIHIKKFLSGHKDISQQYAAEYLSRNFFTIMIGWLIIHLGLLTTHVCIVLFCFAYKLIRYDGAKVLERSMGKWKCLWCSKVLEGESFMDLIAASAKEKGGQHVHGWENVSLVEKATTAPVVILENERIT